MSEITMARLEDLIDSPWIQRRDRAPEDIEDEIVALARALLAMTSERDEALAKFDTILDDLGCTALRARVAELEAERDEWKVKFEYVGEMWERSKARLALLTPCAEALRECCDLIQSACPDASFWVDTLGEQCDAALDALEGGEDDSAE